ncbi:MAG: hypothetical protein JKZ03_01225 [Flavobacteriaceae bacterium]|nr:hypothetical protein [Flavobacteriaceae bacterium]
MINFTYIQDIKKNYAEAFKLVEVWLDEGLVALYLPADNPKNSMYFHKHIEGDTFRYVNDKGDLTTDELTFKRDKKGNVIGVINDNGNYNIKINRAQITN